MEHTEGPDINKSESSKEIDISEEFDKLYSGDFLNRLDNIKQWSEKDVIHKESVSQHSFKVAVLARVFIEGLCNISRNIKEREANEIKLTVTTNALFHDFDEAMLLRDISHETKYNDYNGDELRDKLNDLVEYLIDKSFGVNSFVKKSTCESHPLEKSIVKLCDWLCLKRYIEVEEKLGNNSLHEIYKYCKIGVGDSAKKVEELWSDEFEELIKIDLNNERWIKRY